MQQQYKSFIWRAQEVVMRKQFLSCSHYTKLWDKVPLLVCHHVWLPQWTLWFGTILNGFAMLGSFSPHKNYPYWCVDHGSFSLLPLYIQWICQSVGLFCHPGEFELFLILVLWTLLATTIIISWPYLHLICRWHLQWPHWLTVKYVMEWQLHL